MQTPANHRRIIGKGGIGKENKPDDGDAQIAWLCVWTGKELAVELGSEHGRIAAEGGLWTL